MLPNEIHSPDNIYPRCLQSCTTYVYSSNHVRIKSSERRPFFTKSGEPNEDVDNAKMRYLNDGQNLQMQGAKPNVFVPRVYNHVGDMGKGDRTLLAHHTSSHVKGKLSLNPPGRAYPISLRTNIVPT